jgi:hypothetical protein
MRPQLGFRPTRYEEFTEHPESAEIAMSVLFTVLGNLDDLSRARGKLEDTFDDLDRVLELLAAAKGLGRVGKALADFLAHAIEFGVDAAITVLEPLAPLIKREIPALFPKLLNVFIPLDADKSGMGTGEPQAFRDYGWQGLPMDNQGSDVLVPTEFTEIWIPLPRTADAMRVLNDYLTEPEDDREAYRRTGIYAWELYSAKPTPFWISPAHSAGDDEWREGAFRVDIYWFAENAADPVEAFFPQFWELFRSAGIPFRLHWGKYQPAYAANDRTWVDFLGSQYPRWDDFLRLREKRDPSNLFLNGYWRDRFGLWDAPPPSPVPAPG